MIQNHKNRNCSEARIPRADTVKVTTHQMCKLAKRVLGRDGDDLVKIINSWASTRGKKECISMMKNRWNYIQHLAAEDLTPSELKELANTYRISLKSNSVYPKGVYGNLAHNYVNGGPKTKERISSFLKSYTMITPKLTNKDVNKLLETIQSDHEISYAELFRIEDIIDDFDIAGFSGPLLSDLRRLTEKGLYSELDLLDFNLSRKRYTSLDPDWDQDSMNLIKGFLFSQPTDERFRELLLGDEDIYDVNDINLSLLFSYASEIQFVAGGGRETGWTSSLPNSGLQVIPKAGAVGRVIASLNSWDQLVLRPLHKVLDYWTKNVDVFRHYNQLSGASAVAHWKDSVAIDLTAATDMLPVDLFLEWLRKHELFDITDMISNISSQPYEVKLPEGGKRVVNYTRGQPMGMYASFPILQICNLMVAWSAYKNTPEVWKDYGDPSDREIDFLWSVVIVGDDIAFSDARVAKTYCKIMNSLGVPINKYKCFSNRKSQFAGFEIDQLSGRFEGHRFYYRPFKFQPDRYLSDKRTRLGMYYTFPEAWEIKYGKGKDKSLPIMRNPLTRNELKRRSLLPDLTYIESAHGDCTSSMTRSRRKVLDRIMGQVNAFMMKYDLCVDGSITDTRTVYREDHYQYDRPYSFNMKDYVEAYGDSEIAEDRPDLTRKSKRSLSK